MRTGFALIVALIVAVPAMAQKKPEPAPRFGVAGETEFYSQESPKQAMASILKALERKRIDYMLAQLIDPTFTEDLFARYYKQKHGKSPEEDFELPPAQRAERIKAGLNAFVAEVNTHLASDAKQALRFTRLLKDGNVEEAGTTAKVTIADLPTVSLNFKQIDGRWFMASTFEAEKPKK